MMKRIILALTVAAGLATFAVPAIAAELTASSVLYVTAFAFAAPISTTHTITSSILGVGATRRLSAVRWGVAGNIVWAWVLTLPMAALASAVTFWVLSALTPL